VGRTRCRQDRCFLIPCPNNKRDAPKLLPLIKRSCILPHPGSIVQTDEWPAYNSLTAAAYSHNSVNHSIQFVDPATGSGTHTNSQRGHCADHVTNFVVRATNLELAPVDFMFKRRFHATGGSQQISNCFNGYLSVLKA
jgi:hypothetical protein